MKLSAGPLLHCLLRAMSQPTAHGSCPRFQKNTLESSQHVQMMPSILTLTMFYWLTCYPTCCLSPFLLIFQMHPESPNPGKQVSLGTALSEFWPDFSQRGKAASIGDVLQHQAGLAKPFPSSLDVTLDQLDQVGAIICKKSDQKSSDGYKTVRIYIYVYRYFCISVFLYIPIPSVFVHQWNVASQQSGFFCFWYLFC